MKGKSSLQKRPQKTKALTVQDEEQLWKNCVVSEQNPNLSSLTIQHNCTATPASQTVVHHFHGCSGRDKLQSWCWCFSTKQQLNTERSLSVPFLNFTVVSLHHCSDCKNRDLKVTFIELFPVVCCQCFELASQNTVNHFFH